MSAIYLTSVQPEHPIDNRWRFGAYDLFRHSASLSKSGPHQITENPETAAVILFTDEGPEPYFASIFRSDLYKKHWRKCFVFSSNDFPLALMPGIYASIEKRWHDERWTRSGFYANFSDLNRLERLPFNKPTYLFSFVGSSHTDPVRRRLNELQSPDFHRIDTTGVVQSAFTVGDQETIRKLTDQYRNSVLQSRFVLCPRGFGCSSVRLFEVMKMGRAPVIISDPWVPPVGPDWAAFSIRVREADIFALPKILAGYADQAEAMGAMARKQWERWFSPETVFQTVAGYCLELLAAGKSSSRWSGWARRAQFARPMHARILLRVKRRQWKEAKKRQAEA